MRMKWPRAHGATKATAASTEVAVPAEVSVLTPAVSHAWTPQILNSTPHVAPTISLEPTVSAMVVQAGPVVSAVVPEVSSCPPAPPLPGLTPVNVESTSNEPMVVQAGPEVSAVVPEISNCPPYLGEPSVIVNVDPTPEISNCPPYLGEPTINVNAVLSTTAMVVENPTIAAEPTPEISNCPPYLGEPGVTINVDPTPEISNCPPYPGPVGVTLSEVLTLEESAPTWIACGPVSMEPASVTTVVSIACEPIVSVITELPIDFVEALPVM